MENQNQEHDRVGGANWLATALIVNVVGVPNIIEIGEQLMTLLIELTIAAPVPYEKPPHETLAEQVRRGSVAWFIHVTAPRTH